MHHVLVQSEIDNVIFLNYKAFFCCCWPALSRFFFFLYALFEFKEKSWNFLCLPELRSFLLCFLLGRGACSFLPSRFTCLYALVDFEPLRQNTHFEAVSIIVGFVCCCFLPKAKSFVSFHHRFFFSSLQFFFFFINSQPWSDCRHHAHCQIAVIINRVFNVLILNRVLTVDKQSQ